VNGDIVAGGLLFAIALVGGFFAGLIYGLGQTLRILRNVRDSIPPTQVVARAALGDAISRFER
jgi:hypothetical protein